MHHSSRLILMLAALICGLLCESASAEWVVEDDVCVERFGARDLARGPLAIGNGVLLPLRVFPRAFYGSGLRAIPLSLGYGVWWIATGALDTVTIGMLHVAPTESSLLPFAERNVRAMWKPYTDYHDIRYCNDWCGRRQDGDILHCRNPETSF